jgi:hypothetical protein
LHLITIRQKHYLSDKNKQMKKFTLLALAIITVTAVNAQLAAPVTQNQTVTLNLANKIEISIEGTPTGTSFTFDDAADYATGLINLEASEFRVKSNQNFAVTVASNTANFTSTAATTMPSTVLGVRLNGGSTFANLTTSAAALTTGSRGNTTFKVDYKADPGYSYDAGAYSLVVVYTATQQ